MSKSFSSASLISLYRSLIASTLLAVASILIYFILPERRYTILPDKAGSHHLFFDAQMNGKTTGEWIDEKKFHFKCTMYSGGTEWPYCGLHVAVGKLPNGKDLSAYKRLELKLSYQGANERLRITLQNFNPVYSNVANQETLKGLDVQFLVEETRGPIIIHDYEWRSSEHWLKVNKIPRALSYNEFNNIVFIGVDLPSPIAPGEHDIHVQSIEFYGELFPAEEWYLGVSLLWLFANLALLQRHLFLQQKLIRDSSESLSSLSSNVNTLKQESQKYKELSNMDSLTGVLNRHGFAEEMRQFSTDNLLNCNAALILIDIDHFKNINDTYGHDAGDAVLREIVLTIRHAVLGSDQLIRWGGEEFILLCKDTNEEQAALVAERIRVAVERHTIQFASSNISVTLSLGVGIARSLENFDELFHRTDQAMYKAKNSGRNRVVFAE